MIVRELCPAGCLVEGPHEHAILSPLEGDALRDLLRPGPPPSLTSLLLRSLRQRGGCTFRRADGTAYEVRAIAEGEPVWEGTGPAVTLAGLDEILAAVAPL